MNNRILLVEDDESIQETLATVLRDEGYEVMIAAHGAAALTMAAQYQPGLILLDIRMPVMNGFQFVQAYHAEPGPHMPIIAITASKEAESVPSLDVAAFLLKPFLLNDLLDLIAHYLPSIDPAT